MNWISFPPAGPCESRLRSATAITWRADSFPLARQRTPWIASPLRGRLR